MNKEDMEYDSLVLFYQSISKIAFHEFIIKKIIQDIIISYNNYKVKIEPIYMFIYIHNHDNTYLYIYNLNDNK